MVEIEFDLVKNDITFWIKAKGNPWRDSEGSGVDDLNYKIYEINDDGDIVREWSLSDMCEKQRIALEDDIVYEFEKWLADSQFKD